MFARLKRAAFIRYPVLGVLIIAGCVDAGAVRDFWIGRHVEDLPAVWGAPDKVFTTSNGQTIEYTHSRFISGTQYYCDASFNSDNEGTIVGMLVEGNIGGCNVLLSGKLAR